MPTGTTEPIGATTIRKKRQRDRQGRSKFIRIRFVKTESGWTEFGRHLYEAINGPVPEGKCVYHADLDHLNDDPDNLVAMTPGEWLLHCRKLDPDRFSRNSEGTAEWNQLSAAVRRQMEFLPSRWYLVRDEVRRILNVPFRSKSWAAHALGIKVSKNGHNKIEGPIKILRGSALVSDDARRHYERIGNHPTAKTREALASQLREISKLITKFKTEKS